MKLTEFAADPEVAVQFLASWFIDVPERYSGKKPFITISNARNGLYVADKDKSPASIVLRRDAWESKLRSDPVGLLWSMGKNIYVYPLWTSHHAQRITEQSYESLTIGTPGFWYDVGRITESDLEDLIYFLREQTPDMSPIMVTGKLSLTGATYQSVRMWWPLPIDPGVGMTGHTFVRMAHARHMQRLISQFIGVAIGGTLLQPRATLHDCSYPLPGVDNYKILHQDLSVKTLSDSTWIYLSMLGDEHKAEYSETFEELSFHNKVEWITEIQKDLIASASWDEILTPAGWRNAGMGSDP